MEQNMERVPIPTVKSNFGRWPKLVGEARKAFKEKGEAIRLSAEDYAPLSAREAALLLRNSAFLTHQGFGFHVKTEQDYVLVWFSDHATDEDEEERWRNWSS
jgi:hypothetical protein